MPLSNATCDSALFFYYATAPPTHTASPVTDPLFFCEPKTLREREPRERGNPEWLLLNKTKMNSIHLPMGRERERERECVKREKMREKTKLRDFFFNKMNLDYSDRLIESNF